MLMKTENPGQCYCRNCGSARFRHEKVFEMKEVTNSKFDVTYETLGRFDVIVCASCGCVYDESKYGHILGIVKPVL